MSKAQINIGGRLNQSVSMRPTIGSMMQVGETLSSDSDIKMIDRNKIYPNPLNEKYMKGVSEKDITALQKSIESETLLHNLVVLNDGNDKFRLISGEKRWRAIQGISEHKYHEIFPSGIPCKVLDMTPIHDETDELILLLTCNVIVFSNGLPDTDQLMDLIKSYQKKGVDRKDVISYLSGKLQSTESSIRLLYNRSQAIEDLTELFNEHIISSTALGVLAQSKPEIQETYVVYIREHYTKENPVDQKEAYNIKKAVKRKDLPDTTVTSKTFLTIRNNNNSAAKIYTKLKKAKINDMSNTELELCIKELQETRRLLDECINNFSGHINNGQK